MTEFSYPWSALAAGDGGPSAYTLAVVEGTNKFLQNINPTTDGVVWWQQSPYANLLAPSEPGGGLVRIASGIGMVEGWLYTNDADVDFDIDSNPGNANATDIIVLQRVAASQTVRLARINGAAASKAVLTQTAATWEIPIVDVVLDGAGLLSSITDARKLALPPGTIVKLGEDQGGGSGPSFSNIPPLFSNLRIVGRARGTAFALPVASYALTFNGPAAPLYTQIKHDMDSTPATTISTLNSASNFTIPGYTGVGGTANYFDSFDVLIPAYATGGYKCILVSYSIFGTGAPFLTGEGVGWFEKTDPITSISMSTGPFGSVQGDSITVLYGEA